MARVTADGIRKRFGPTEILKGVSLDIADGEFMALLGPSGCGKSTLLRILAGLEAADAGTVSLGDVRVDRLRPRDRNLAMVFQSYALYPYMTVAENVALPLLMRRLSALQRLPLLGGFMPGARAARRSVAADVATTAAALGLQALLDRRPAQLSGGQRQRVALARAMVRQPEAFLMDEPLSNLDTQLRAGARAEITDLHRRLGATMIYVTHDQAEAMTMADRVAVLSAGSVLQVSAPQALYDDPVSLAVARFVGAPAINVLDGVVRGSEVWVEDWLLPVTAVGDGPIQVGLRPEALRLSAEGLSASVARLERLGSETILHANTGAATSVAVRLDPPDAQALRIGEPVRIAADPARILLFEASGTRRRCQPQRALLDA